MPTDFGDLLELIHPALAEMVFEGLTVGWMLVATKRDSATFANKAGVEIEWDNTRALRWSLSASDGPNASARTLAALISLTTALGIKLWDDR